MGLDERATEIRRLRDRRKYHEQEGERMLRKALREHHVDAGEKCIKQAADSPSFVRQGSLAALAQAHFAAATYYDRRLDG